MDSISPVQWDNEAQFSMPIRGSGLTGRESHQSLLDAMEFDLTTVDSDHDEDAITGAANWGDVAKIRATTCVSEEVALDLGMGVFED